MSVTASEAVAATLSRTLGLTPLPGWARALPEALGEVARRHGCSLDDVALLAERNAAVLRELAGYATVGETHFFRHPGHFRALAEHLRARRLAEPGAVLRLWSAGCSSGEEGYSMAMAALDALGTLERLEILGTDVSSAALLRAQTAEYGPWSFRGVEPALLERHFEPATVRGRLQPRRPLRSLLRWHHGALLEHARALPDASFEVIFFRNVAIYLDAPTLTGLYREFRRLLRPGGLLVVAPADPRPQEGLFARVDDDSSSVYLAAAPKTRAIAQPFAPPSVEPQRVAEPRRPRRMAAKPRRARTTVDPSAAKVPPPVDAAKVSPAAATTEDPQAWREAAELHLAEGRAAAAVEYLRRALFMEPRHRITRYWYALALSAAGLHDEVARNLRALARDLEGAAADEPLEDGETTVAEMGAAVRLLAGRYE